MERFFGIDNDEDDKNYDFRDVHLSEEVKKAIFDL
jgi:hypothetical protein